MLLAVCKYISSLTRLDRLYLHFEDDSDLGGVVMADEDALHLTTLTKLSSLTYCLPGGIGDSVLSAWLSTWQVWMNCLSIPNHPR